MPSPPTPEVFLSYRHFSDPEGQRVRAFGERLRTCGIHVILDQFYLDANPGGPPDGWPKWSSDRALKSAHVIIIGSQAWFQSFDKTNDPATGLGAATEADDLRNRIYKANGLVPNIRVVLFDEADAVHISEKLEPYHRFHADRNFADIVRWLGGTLPAVAPATPTPVLSSSTPNNLPRLQPFFGRENELIAIRDALDPESRTWGILIDGAGGMGKTSLAVRAAHACLPDQFQRIIFVSVKDREMDDDGVRSLGYFLVPTLLELLNELARELGHPDIPKAAEDQRTRLLLDALRGKRVLLILDNLESLTKTDRDHIFTFVNRLPQGCKAILTSRRRIGAGSTELILERLDEIAALDTLAELALHNPLLAKTSEAERLTLYRETAGKPLLLRWVAGQIGRGHCRTFIDALNFLRSCPPDNDPLEFIFGDLAQEFTPEEEAVLVALTYFSLPAAVPHIATVANLEQSVVELALRTLANRSLVTPDQEEKEHTLVPLVADFLRKHRPEIVQQTGARLEQRAYALIVENGYEKHDRFPILDTAWHTVAPAIPLFLAGDNTRLQRVCDALKNFLRFTGRWDEWLALSQKAESKAVAAEDYGKAGWRAYDVGWIAYMRAQSDTVLASAARAATHWEAAGSAVLDRAAASELRGMGHRLKQDYPAAVTAYHETVDLLRSLSPESANVASSLNFLAGAERLSGQLSEAEGHYHEALRVARAMGFAEGIANSTGNLANLAIDRQDWSTAEDRAREALTLAEKLGRQELIASNSHRLALSLLCQNRAVEVEALPNARRAVEILTRLGSPNLTHAQATLAECEAAVAAAGGASSSPPAPPVGSTDP